MYLELTLADILKMLADANCDQALESRITNVASLEDANETSLSFLGSQKYRSQLDSSRACAILVAHDFDGKAKEGQVFIRVKDPSAAMAYVCERIEKMLLPAPVPGIHPTAFIHEDARVDPSASIGPHCVVEKGATVGAESWLQANVVVSERASVGANCRLFAHTIIYHDCSLGDRVFLHSGVVIGCDGFGYQQIGEIPNLFHKKIPQVGIVCVEDDVEIGSNSCIDRARLGETRIGQGTKIDDLVMIGHNCQIGRHCIIVSQVGLAGSTVLEDYVVFWGQSATVGHIRIGMGSFIAGQSGVTKDLPAGSKVTGTPAYDLMTNRKVEVYTRRLPELFKKVAKLEKLAGNSEEI